MTTLIDTIKQNLDVINRANQTQPMTLTPELRESILTFAREHPSTIIAPQSEQIMDAPTRQAITNLKAQPFWPEINNEFMQLAAKSQPTTMIQFHDVFAKHDARLADAILQRTIEQAPEKILTSERSLKALPQWGALKENAIQRIAEQSPHLLLSDFQSQIKGRKYEVALLTKAAETSVESNPSSVLAAKDALLKLPKGAALVEQAAMNATTENSSSILAQERFFEKQPYAKQLFQKIAASPEGALRMVESFNNAHEEPNATRFTLLKHLTPASEYDLITQARSEAFSSTYHYVLNDLLAKQAKTGNTDITQSLSPEQMGRMGVFLEAAASYGRMNDVLHIIPKDKLPSIINDITKQAATSQDLGASTALYSMITSPKCDPNIRSQIEQAIKREYDQAATPQARDRMGVLASAYAQNAPTGTLDASSEKSFFAGIQHNPRYQLPNMSQIAPSQTVDAKGANNQIMIFADDADSKASFANWKKQYQGKAGWKITEHPHYTHIENTSGKVPVHIYANHPEHRDAGVQEIRQQVAARQGTAEPAFQTFIGRGHSYHADDYFKILPKESTLVFLGSCGGYQNSTKVSQIAPSAQAIATTETGSMGVNDPLLFHLNQQIASGKGVNWHQAQEVLDKIPSQHKDFYILPHKNVPLAMAIKLEELSKAPAKSSVVSHNTSIDELVAPLLAQANTQRTLAIT